MATFRYGEDTFGIADAIAAIYDEENNTFGTVVNIDSIESASLTINMNSAERQGDDIITSSRAKPEAGTLELTYGGNQFDVLTTLMDTQEYESGVTGSRVRGLAINSKPTLTFSLAFLCEAEGGEKMVVWVTKCRVIGDIGGFSAAYGEFQSPSMTVRCFFESNYPDANGNQVLAHFLQYENESGNPLAQLPPTNYLITQGVT